MKLRILDVTENNLNDFIKICTPTIDNKAIEIGIKEKIKWCIEILNKYHFIGKIAYIKDKPIAQIQYYPDEADPLGQKRSDIIVLHCIYNPNPKYQKKGIATKLVQSLITDLKRNNKYRFIASYAFETGEYLSQHKFLTQIGFKPLNKEDVYYSLRGEELKNYRPFSIWRETREEYIPLQEDKGKAIIFYTPTCQVGYVFAYRTAQKLREIKPDISIKLVNYWRNPEELAKRGKNWMIVNAKPIYSNPYTEPAKFKKEIKQALKNNLS